MRAVLDTEITRIGLVDTSTGLIVTKMISTFCVSSITMKIRTTREGGREGGRERGRERWRGGGGREREREGGRREREEGEKGKRGEEHINHQDHEREGLVSVSSLISIGAEACVLIIHCAVYIG